MNSELTNAIATRNVLRGTTQSTRTKVLGQLILKGTKMLNIETLPYPANIGIEHIKEYTLPEDCTLELWVIPKGTKIKLYQSSNFGVVLVPKHTKDSRQGDEIPKTIFTY